MLHKVMVAQPFCLSPVYLILLSASEGMYSLLMYKEN